MGGMLLMIVLGGLGDLAGWGSLYTYPLVTAACLAILYGSLSGEEASAPPSKPTIWAAMRSAANGVLAHLGKISFGLYVFHVAAIRVTEQFWGGELMGVSLNAAALLLTILAATLSYRFI